MKTIKSIKYLEKGQYVHPMGSVLPSEMFPDIGWLLVISVRDKQPNVEAGCEQFTVRRLDSIMQHETQEELHVAG